MAVGYLLKTGALAERYSNRRGNPLSDSDLCLCANLPHHGRAWPKSRVIIGSKPT